MSMERTWVITCLILLVIGIAVSISIYYFVEFDIHTVSSHHYHHHLMLFYLFYTVNLVSVAGRPAKE